MERARGRRSGRGPCAIDAHGQTHQCRVSHRSLDPACQYHDAGAGPGDDPGRAALRRIGTGRECTIAVAAPYNDTGARAGGGQEAGSAEIGACGRAGADRARGIWPGSASSRSGE